jgi:RNA polymerase sigma factor (sigma-70 family)
MSKKSGIKSARSNEYSAGGTGMATSRLNRVVHKLREVSFRQAPQLADRDLLWQFVREKDERAFAALVYRHGPMVLGVCRRILRNAADAEDAFQVVFLVLVRKAPSLRAPESLGNWLYGVAYRTALEAKRAAVKRKVKEAQAMPRTETTTGLAPDLLALLDEELAALPATFRSAVVLCDLEGKTRKEVAQELGCAEGTVASRVARGRNLLAARLARRGVSLSAGALAVALSQGAASAHVPAPLATTTVKAAALVAAGQLAAVSSSVALLLSGVMKAMLLTKVKCLAGLLLVVALVLGAGGLVDPSVGAQDKPAPEKPAAVKPRSELEALRHENELLKLNLTVVLEKVRAQEDELRALKKQGGDAQKYSADAFHYYGALVASAQKRHEADTVKAAEDALKSLREVSSAEMKKRVADALERAAKKLREQPKEATGK